MDLILNQLLFNIHKMLNIQIMNLSTKIVIMETLMVDKEQFHKLIQIKLQLVTLTQHQNKLLDLLQT
jgi:hypothetical protein